MPKKAQGKTIKSMKKRKKHKSDSHEFSLYWPKLGDVFSSLLLEKQFQIGDDALCHRIVRVLRFSVGEQFVLFNAKFHVRVRLKEIVSKHSIRVQLLEKNENISLKPHIVFFLPLLKRDALEASIYSLVELGASEIQLMMTEKTQRKWGGQKELDRLHTIMIAASEQSKQYMLPKLHEPKLFQEVVNKLHGESCFFFDPKGKDLFCVLELLRTSKPKTLSLMVGPEGDLTSDEKKSLLECGVMFCKLTPTILRARQAVAVSLGAFRACI